MKTKESMRDVLLTAVVGCALIVVLTGVFYLIVARRGSGAGLGAGSALGSGTELASASTEGLRLESDSPVEADEPDEDVELIDGERYIKLNIFELYHMCRHRPGRLEDDRYVMRGLVYESDGLAAEGCFGLMRVALWCCVAHSVAYGFKVPIDSLGGLEHGQWVKVYGRPRPAQGSGAAGRAGAFETDMAPNTDLNAEWVLVPDRVEPIPEPEDVYIERWRKRRPYKY